MSKKLSYEKEGGRREGGSERVGGGRDERERERERDRDRDREREREKERERERVCSERAFATVRRS